MKNLKFMMQWMQMRLCNSLFNQIRIIKHMEQTVKKINQNLLKNKVLFISFYVNFINIYIIKYFYNFLLKKKKIIFYSYKKILWLMKKKEKKFF